MAGFGISNFIKIFLILSIAFVSCPGISIAVPTNWKKIAEGINYTTIYKYSIYREQKIHAFQIDLKKYQLHWISAKAFNSPSVYAKEAQKKASILLAINGGFFSRERDDETDQEIVKPLGLRITQHQIANPFKPISWWSIFVLKNGKAAIVPKGVYEKNKDQYNHSDFAIQAGPRLVKKGKVSPNLYGKEAQRSLLGITPKGDLIVAMTENWSMTTTELGEILRKPTKDGGLDCYDALNLDGGSSSQLFAKISHFHLNAPLPSLRPVAGLIVLEEK